MCFFDKNKNYSHYAYFRLSGWRDHYNTIIMITLKRNPDDRPTMEDLLKNISGSKTFSIARKAPILEKDTNYDADRLGISKIPVPMTVSTGKRPEVNNGNYNEDYYKNNCAEWRRDSFYSYSEFILNDRNIFLQRKTLLYQEKLQKQTVAALASASNIKKLNTMGLAGSNVVDDNTQQLDCFKDDVIFWPQCKQFY